MKLFYPIIFISILIAFFALTACGQSPRVQRLYQSCANSTAKAEIRIENGDIFLKPCPAKKAYYNNVEIGTGAGGGNAPTPTGGIASLNGLTDDTQTFASIVGDVTGIASVGTTHTFTNPISSITGASRTNFFPYFTGQNTLGKSNISQSGGTVNFTGAVDFSSATVSGLASGGITSLNGLTAAAQNFGAITANDAASWTSAADTHTLQLPITAVSGAARTGFLPFYDGANSLGKSSIEQTTNKLTMFPGNVSGSGLYGIFDAATNLFFVGDGSQNRYININGTSGAIDVANSLIRIGKFPQLGNDVLLTLNNANKTTSLLSDVFSVNNQTQTSLVNFTGVQNFNYQRTITPGATTGAQVINKPVGTINFAAGANSLVVTNSIVTTNSIINATARTNDATCAVKSAVAAAGSFTINMSASCTTETSVGFQVLN